MKSTCLPACVMAALLAVEALSSLPVRADTLVVLGLRNELPDNKKYRDWQDYCLGMGIRGRLAQMAANTGSFELLEERLLATSVREALGGYWLDEPPQLRDPAAVLRATGANWVLYGDLDHVGVTRDRMIGPINMAIWRYRIRLKVCLYGDTSGALCQEAEGKSKTKKAVLGFEYRGKDLAWDQAGPAEAITQALGEAFDAVVRKASTHIGHRDATRTAGNVLKDEMPLPVYVAAFGLSPAVACSYPKLAASQVGLGLSQRIVDALYNPTRFKFVEEKAELIEHITRLLRNEPVVGGDASAEVQWLFYGEVVDLQVARSEKITRGAVDLETRITLQVRLVERSSQLFYSATATGVHVSRLVDWKGERSIDDLDERSIGIATDAAIREAVEMLVRSLFESE